MDFGRKLIIFPVTHTYADLGSVGKKLPYDDEQEMIVRKDLAEIFDCVRQLKLDFAKVKVYQDGLADVPLEIVDKVVTETNSENFTILRWLREQGASIVGIEDPSLLVEERQMLHNLLDSQDTDYLDYLKKITVFVELRDEYIAKRIGETLLDGETGILFIGKSHDIGSLLEGKMEAITIEGNYSLQPEAKISFGAERKFA